MEHQGSPNAVGNSNTSLAKQIPLWIGVVASAITIILTVWNAYTKRQIDMTTASLDQLRIELQHRAETREAFKEKVGRYSWILSLFPDLVNETDPRKRDFTLSLVRLSLEQREADQLFASLQASSQKELQAVGQSGLSVIQNEQVTELGNRINEINAATADIRKRAVADLLAKYAGSSEAITLVLKLYGPDYIDDLSASGIINGLVFLNGTNVEAWTKQQLQVAQEAAARIRKRGIGSQTAAVLDTFESHMNKVRAVQNE